MIDFNIYYNDNKPSNLYEIQHFYENKHLNN